MNALAIASVERVELVAASTQETSTIDLKSEFDPACAGDWCELIKDIVAMANTSGGRIIIGLNDDGSASGFDPQKVLDVDPAVFVDKVYSYTGVHFPGVATTSETHAGARVAVMIVAEASTPLVFKQAGNYQAPNGKQRNAFNPGTLYVRHGAKSEPATSDDVRDMIERHIRRDRVSLLASLRQVVEAPTGSFVTVSPVASAGSEMAGRPVRLVLDAAAEPGTFLDPNITHPHRQKEVVEKVNAHFQGRVRVTTNNIVAIRRIHKSEEDRLLCYRPKYGSPLYSDMFVQWVTSQIEDDVAFLAEVRQRYHQMTIERNQQRKKNHRLA